MRFYLIGFVNCDGIFPEKMTEIQKLEKIWINFKFQVVEFECLFPDDRDVEALREKTLPEFFWLVNELFWDTFLITIAKLLDKEEQGQNLNLTLYTLATTLEKKGIKEYIQIKEKIDGLNERYKSVIIYRRKYLAHFDKDYTMGIRRLNSITHIDDVNKFLMETLSLINETKKLLSLEPFSGFFMYPAKYRGSKELLRILVRDHNRIIGGSVNS